MKVDVTNYYIIIHTTYDAIFYLANSFNLQCYSVYFIWRSEHYHIYNYCHCANVIDLNTLEEG